MKKSLATFATCLMFGGASLLASCNNKVNPSIKSEDYIGYDQFGRTYGATYAIDSATQVGWFKVEASCFKTGNPDSSSMVDKYRLSFMTLVVKEGSYDLIYHGTSEDCDEIFIVRDGKEEQAELNQIDGIWNFTIKDLNFSEISSTLAMKAHIPAVPSFVYPDKKTSFDCVLDLADATLINEGELPKVL